MTDRDFPNSSCLASRSPYFVLFVCFCWRKSFLLFFSSFANFKTNPSYAQKLTQGGGRLTCEYIHLCREGGGRRGRALPEMTDVVKLVSVGLDSVVAISEG